MAQIPARKCGFCNNAVAALYCEDCHQILCVGCRQNVHDKVPFLQDHKVTNIQKEGNRVFRPQPVCETHKNQFLYYCSKCECLTCAECMTSNHNEHKTEKIKTVADTCRQTVIQYIEKIKTKVELVKKKLETIDTEHSAQIKSDCESYVSKVTITAGELHEIIDRFKQIHMTTASDFKDIENQDLQNKRAFFQRRHDEIVDRLLKFENLLQETHASIFLTDWKALQTDFTISDEEIDDSLACPRQLELFHQSNFGRSVIDEIDEKFQMRLKEKENSVNELQIENNKLKNEIQLKEDENEKLSKDFDTRADHNKKLIIHFEDKIKDLEKKLNQTEKENTSTSKARTGSSSDPQMSEQQQSFCEADNQNETTHKPKQEEEFKHIVEIKIPNIEYRMLKFFCPKCQLFKGSPTYDNGSLRKLLQADETEDGLKKFVRSKSIHFQSLINFDVPMPEGWLIPDAKLKEIETELKIICPEIFCYRSKDAKAVTLKGNHYEKLQMAKTKCEFILGIKQKGRGGRRERVISTDPSYKKEGNEQMGNKLFSKSFNPSRSSFFQSFSGGSSSPSSPPLSAATFKTSEGLLIHVHLGKILDLKVDCIVNAANESLSHGGGVADVISRAAGYDFQQESDDYIQRHGQLNVTKCCTTSAGSLPYQFVIHAVGPRWYNYTDKRKCADDLEETVKNCFQEAEEKMMTSVAIPAISSGIFGVPRQVCCTQYCNAVKNYSTSNGKTTFLREIHYIDKDASLVALLQKEFQQNLNI